MHLHFKAEKGFCQMTHTVPQNMKAAVMHNTREIKIETLPVPDINHDEVLIKVMAVGICGSDLHYYTNGRIGNYVVEKPFILGHECAGEIAAVGSAVGQFKVGDRVAVEPGVTCVRRAKKGVIIFARMYSFWRHRRLTARLSNISKCVRTLFFRFRIHFPMKMRL